ncbi:glycosyltransferase [Acuticoccus sp.]|uniref:glycosyltransferase n=1 Tax=Acuticoccus sp. TaxID=1904378 RepID=UPI003B52AAC9
MTPLVPLDAVAIDLFGATRFAAAIVVPARDEAEGIGALVASLAAQQGAAPFLTVIVVNGSRDATFALAVAALRGARLPHIILDAAVGEGGVGAARRLGAEAARPLAPNAAILFTDADCVLDHRFVSAALAHLRHADAVCGLAALSDADEAGLTLLSPWARHEAIYGGLCRAVAARIDPEQCQGDEHDQTGGAALAVRRRTYDAVGGFTALPFGEDGDLVGRCVAAGFRIVRKSDMRVLTSARTVGRTPYGMATTLAERATEVDPVADRALEPFGAMVRRAAARARCRELTLRGASLASLARRFAVPPAEVIHLDRSHSFGAAWSHLERHSPHLARTALRFSALGNEIAAAERWMAAG